VVVIGDVNPGAEIIAGGNIVVWGRTGMAHAGAEGNTDAIVCALDLMPIQLRIADQISMAPQQQKKGQPQMVRLLDGKVAAESWIRNELIYRMELCREKVVTITSGKGGVGKTTASANLGAALASDGLKVVCIDADIGLRNLDVVMGLENRIVYDLVDLVEGRCRTRQAIIRDKRLPELYSNPGCSNPG
jgi:Mrp family chromosome partitioning ATPase